MDGVGGKKGSSCSVKEQEVPARLHILLGRQMWPSAERAENLPARERPGSARGRSRSLGLQRRPRFFQAALPEPPGSSGNSSIRPRPPSSRARHPGEPAAGRTREGRRSSRTLPWDARPHYCGAVPGGGGCWGCCGRPLIPSPILECYSVTYNRVTRAAADVPNASIGHRNKEGRVPGSGLYNPELRDALIGSGGSGAGGERSRESCAATRNPIVVLSWEPCEAGAFVQGIYDRVSPGVVTLRGFATVGSRGVVTEVKED